MAAAAIIALCASVVGILFVLPFVVLLCSVLVQKRKCVPDWVYCVATMGCLPVLVAGLFPIAICQLLLVQQLIAFTFKALWTLIESVNGFRSHLQQEKVYSSSQYGALSDYRVMIIISAYLDNELNVLPLTLPSYTRLQYNSTEPIAVCIVFNCSDLHKQHLRDAAVKLYTDWHDKRIGHCHFQVHWNEKSTSKSENVNFMLEKAKHMAPDIIGLFDADHCPDVLSVQHAAREFGKGNVDVVQGNCAVRNADASAVASFVAVEFQDKYNVGHEGRTNTSGIGLFGGSNGYWRADLLMQIKMKKEFLTEDIDASFRALRSGARIQYCHAMMSTELATETISALIKQRTRWFQGWLEVAVTHLLPSLRSSQPALSAFGAKLGLLLLLLYKEVFAYLTFAPLIFACILTVRTDNRFVNAICFAVGTVLTSVNCLRLVCVYRVARGPVRRNKYWLRYFVQYMVLSLPYQAFLHCIQVAAHWRYLAGKRQWVVTNRAKPCTH